MNIRSTIKISILTSLLMFASQTFSETNHTNHTNHTNANTTIASKTPKADATITKSINKLIDENKMLSKLKINVSTKNRIVTLSGNVDSDTQASLLVELAQSVALVSNVDISKLIIKDSQHPLADAMITAKIKGLFIREKLFGEKDIASINTSVETKDGVVYLSGVVDNQKQIDNAIEIIKKYIPEIKKIEYSIQKNVPID